jgi:phage regulator Rha-like protein
MSSLEIADLTGKRHPDVVRDLKVMLESLGGDVSSFARIYRDTMNRAQTEYHLPKRESLILVSGYDVHLRAKIIDRWQVLEAHNAPATANLNDPATKPCASTQQPRAGIPREPLHLAATGLTHCELPSRSIPYAPGSPAPCP